MIAISPEFTLLLERYKTDPQMREAAYKDHLANLSPEELLIYNAKPMLSAADLMKEDASVLPLSNPHSHAA